MGPLWSCWAVSSGGRAPGVFWSVWSSWRHPADKGCPLGELTGGGSCRPGPGPWPPWQLLRDYLALRHGPPCPGDLGVEVPGPCADHLCPGTAME